MDNPKILSFTYGRRFGVEMELNSFDKRDFQQFPLDTKNNEQPKGIAEIAQLVLDTTGQNVNIKGWHHTHDNNNWVIKPDRSCGMELCSPVSKGWPGLKHICEVADVLSRDKRISCDQRCSLHVHVEIADCVGEYKQDLAKILTYWVKSESVFLDSVPSNRKRNCYCQCIGMTDLFEHNSLWDENDVIYKLGSRKYYTANCFHYLKTQKGEAGRNTIEFRIAENEACLDPFLIKNWVRLLIHFVEQAKKADIPPLYNPNNPWSGFCWLDPEDVMQFLGFTDGQQLSLGMEQTRNWFLARLYRNVSKTDLLPGIWSEVARRVAREQVEGIIRNLGLNKDDMQQHLLPSNPDLLYSSEYKA
jgi:hypothetical protein